LLHVKRVLEKLTVRSREAPTNRTTTWIVTLLLFLALSWTYSHVTPLLEMPDESSHFEVVAYLAAQRHLPPLPIHSRTGIAPLVSTDVPYYYAPPLYYVLSALLVGNSDTRQFATAVIPNPNFSRGRHISQGLDLSSKNMYVHTADQRFPYSDWAIAFRRVRLFSLLLGSATVVGSIVLTSLLWPGALQQRWRWVAVCLVAFNATFLYTSGGVSNDALLVAISTWSLVLMVYMLVAGAAEDRKSAIFGRRESALALCLGAGALTKQSALILWPLAGVALLLAARQQGWHWRKSVATLLAVSTTGFLLGGWWYVQNWLLYGDALALSTHASLPWVENVTQRVLFLLAQSRGTFESYWATFGWATIFVHPVWYIFFAILMLVGVSGWLLPMPKEAHAPWPREVSIILWLAVLLNGLTLLGWLWRTAAPYGRLLFPVIAPVACLIVEGWRRWFLRLPLRSPRLVRLWQTAVPAAVIALALVVPVRYLQPAFATAIANIEEVAQAMPVQARFGNTYQLAAYTFTPERPKPGETIQLTLFWRLAHPLDDADDLDVFVQLAPRDPEKRVASIDTLLGTTRYPTSIWRSEETIRQRFLLPVPQDAPTPALYWFNVGVYNAPLNTPLSATLAEQPLPENMLRLGPLTIISSTQVRSEPVFVTRKDFDDAIRLYGYDLMLSQQDETKLQLTLYWQALGRPVMDWTVFIHLLDQDGQLVAQHDAPPVAGNYPTSWWQPGDQVLDVYTLVPEEQRDLSGYILKVGLYNPLDGRRAVVVDGQQRLLPESAVLLEVP
jgi:hypothetical protein